MKEEEILSRLRDRLHIASLNPMQLTALQRSRQGGDMVLLSPTGTGKTVAYLLPVLQAIKADNGSVQCVVIAPSRELVLQIYGVARELVAGLKVTCCYGGHNVADEKKSLAATPAIIIATPGRLLDHIDRRHIDIATTRLLVLDEFDKSLELGFLDEMRRIIGRMPRLSRRFLTSATRLDQLPTFLRLHNVQELDFLAAKEQVDSRLTVWQVQSAEKDKLGILLQLLSGIDSRRTMVFVNYRESVERVVEFLRSSHCPAIAYHGGMEQMDREIAITLFNNGSAPVIVTTDLAARGLDIAHVGGIVHYHLPSSQEVYTHRNGRTARVDATGEAFVITGPEEQLPSYIKAQGIKQLSPTPQPTPQPAMASLYFSAGKKEKISRGDIAGFLLHNTSLQATEIGTITLQDHYAIAAIPATKAKATLQQIAGQKIKNKRLKITLIHR